MIARHAVCVLVALFGAAAAPAGARCVPESLPKAIAKSRAVRIVQLGPVTDRVPDPRGELPDRFLGLRVLERFDVTGDAKGWLLDAFGWAGRYDCDAPSGWASTRGAPAGVIGIELETSEGTVRIVLTLPGGEVEVGRLGKRQSARTTVDAAVAWTEFVRTFARERRRTPEEFVAAMLAEQPPPARRALPPEGSAKRPGAAIRADSLRPTPDVDVAPPARRPAGNPAPGEYVYVEELPEAIHRVPPVYPDAAREAGVTGTVLVQALVGKDGKVNEVRVQKSIPMLDEAAVAAVRQWLFKPARSKGEPVAVWVAVPVRFPPSDP